MYKDILVTVDLGKKDPEEKTIQTAVEYAQAFGATLHVMTVVPDYGLSFVGGFFPEGHEQAALHHAQDALHAFTATRVPASVPHRHIVGHGSIYREILRFADVVNADLIVVAATAPDIEDYLIGPNAARVVRHARVSVLVIR